MTQTVTELPQQINAFHEWTIERQIRLGLMPCPFCAQTPQGIVVRKHPSYAWKYQVLCENPDCKCIAGTVPNAVLENAVNAWNTRWTMSPVPAMLEAMDEEEFFRA